MSTQEQVNKATEFWSKVADENGWSMEGRGVTVWVDDDGKMVDSLYNPQANTSESFIVRRETEELIETI